jgi:hypothetical protein
MNHNQAVELQLAVKYVLGELPPVQRDEYEDHYIDCPACARDVHAAAAFADTARAVFRQEARNDAPAQVRIQKQGGWFAWLRPAFAVPALAALLLFVTYQNTVTIPRAKEVAAHSASQLFASSFSLNKANTRGGELRGEEASEGEEVKVQVHPNESFALKFDFTPSRIFDSYICQLQDASGRSLLEENVPGTSTNKEQQLVVRGGLVKPGKYNLVFTGVPGSSGQGGHEEVLRLGFSVEFHR